MGSLRALKVAIADDEVPLREELAAMVERYAKDNDLNLTVHCYSDGAELLEAGAKEDIFLLDIEMPDVDGMKVARRLRNAGVTAPIVFVTNLAQYAVKGYEVSALDFIVKPVQYAPFAFKFRRAVEAAAERRHKVLTIQTPGGVSRVDTRDLLYLEVSGHKLIYHTASGNVEVWGTMRAAAAELDGCGFEFCNACYLVNVEKVVRIEADTVYVGSDALKMSRGKRKTFLDAVTRQAV